jgi:hypothetical protein
MSRAIQIIRAQPRRVAAESAVLAGMFGIFWILAVFGHAVMGG